jgi:hypothetical protein
MTITEAEAVASLLATSFAEVFINGSREHPTVVARGHNQAWSPQRIMTVRLGKKRTGVIANPNTQRTDPH